MAESCTAGPEGIMSADSPRLHGLPATFCSGGTAMNDAPMDLVTSYLLEPVIISRGGGS
jgi:hypothetical protein